MNLLSAMVRYKSYVHIWQLKIVALIDRNLDIPDESGKSSVKPELVRPLPWILFLPGLVILRSLRASLNIGAFIFGLSSIEPITVVRLTTHFLLLHRDNRIAENT